MSTDDEQTQEIIQEAPEEPQGSIVEVPIEETVEEPPKAKAKARGKRGPDRKTRAKPKPKAKVTMQRIQESESESESADEATLQEIHSLNLLRSIRAYESQRVNNKHRLYSSWFGR